MNAETVGLEHKANMYRLFAHVFAKEPTAEFLRFLSKKSTLFDEKLEIDPLDDLKNLSHEKQEELLAVEYAGLFLLPGVATSPHESVQRGEENLWSASTVQVNRIYKEFGFELDADFKDTPDHISAELSFLAELSTLESKYKEESSEAQKGVLEVKKYFLKNHLLAWFPVFERKIASSAKLSYYKAFASLLRSLLNAEWESLKEVKDIS